MFEVPEYPVRENLGGAIVDLGSAEIRVSGTSKTYACPTLIYHYIRTAIYRRKSSSTQ